MENHWQLVGEKETLFQIFVLTKCFVFCWDTREQLESLIQLIQFERRKM